MEHPRWKKIFADIWGNKMRSLLVVLSIATGVFAIGFVTTTSLILKADVPADYFTANPHAAILYTDPFDDDLLATVRKVDGIERAEGRADVQARLLGGDGTTYPLQLMRYPELEDTQIDLLRLEQGADRLAKCEVFLERQVAEKLGYLVGDSMVVELKNGDTRDLVVAGLVQAVTGTKFLYTKYADAYTNGETLVSLHGPEQYTQLVLTVSADRFNKAHIGDVAEAAGNVLRDSGLRVYSTQVPQPGQTPSQPILDAMLALMGLLGALALVLCAVLVFNTISALMGQQVRMIGMMKAIGATSGQLSMMYLVLVLAFGLVALLLALPLSALGAYGLCSFIAKMMNVNLAPFRVPLPAIVLQVIIGLLIPAAGALAPVLGGARRTVRESLNSYGLAGGRRTWFDRLLESVQGLPRPLLLSLRNTFRRKARLALTLVMLSLGGAIFISVFGLRDSIYAALDQTFGYSLSDVNVTLAQRDHLETMQQHLKGVGGIVRIEGWGHDLGQVMQPDGEGDFVEVIAPPAGSKLIRPVLTAGRWLLPEDENALVVGNAYLKIRPGTQAGDVLPVRFGEREFDFTVVGVYEMAGTPNQPIVFVSAEYLDRVTSQGGRVDRLRIVTDASTPERQRLVQKAVEARFKQLKVDATVQTGSDVISSQSAPVKVLVVLLLVMAMLIALVGGFGLMGTMSMNVLERTREIGVMRSIGAVNAAIFEMVVAEGLLVGLISWGLGALLSLPVTRLLDRGVGVAMLNVPLDFIFSTQGLLIWLAVVLVLAALASLVPARSAVRLTIRDVLAYE